MPLLHKKENLYSKKSAFQFILLMGLVSLMGDITYEGARSISGPYLAVLGASAAAVGLISGIGEFFGYAFRFVSGYLADRTEKYWLFTFIGYGLILCVPFLGYADYWQTAGLFIILERFGKAVRSPSRDVLLSHAAKKIGRGMGFGIHEALDQVGAILGPLIFTTIFILGGEYSDGFKILWIPAILVVLTLLIARWLVPSTKEFELSVDHENSKKYFSANHKLSKIFWYYIFFSFLSVTGFINFQLISYHFKVHKIVPDIQIPVFYAIAMGVDGLAALTAGNYYDKIGLKALYIAPALTAFIPFFTLGNNYYTAFIGVVLWGIVMGTHETIMRAAVADLICIENRGTAYGIFNAFYGAALFAGSLIMGYFYNFSVSAITAFAVLCQIMSVPVFIFLIKSKEIKYTH